MRVGVERIGKLPQWHSTIDFFSFINGCRQFIARSRLRCAVRCRTLFANALATVRGLVDDNGAQVAGRNDALGTRPNAPWARHGCSYHYR